MIALPVQRRSGDAPGGDSLAQLDRLHADLGSWLDVWGPLPDLPTGFVPRADVEERHDRVLPASLLRRS